MPHNPIKLNDILKIDNLENHKIRLLTTYSNKTNPLDFFRNNNNEELMKWLFWNYSKQSFKKGQTVIGLVRIEGHKWLLFNISTVTKVLKKYNDVGFEYEIKSEYQKYFGRVIVNYHNKSQNLIRNASSIIDDCYISQIIEDKFEDEEFPGYENINISWQKLKRIINKSSWRTALQNQKGVYLITDISNGKMYVGSASGKDMILGRWESYIKTYHGNNVDLKILSDNHIKTNFRYSILDIFKSTIDDKVILARENWWKNTLQTRKFGYNKN